MERREPSDPTEVVLRVHGPSKQGSAVPADVLVRAIAGLQQTVLLLAAGEEKQVVRERFRPSEKLRERATLLCEVSTTGSYAIPMRLASGQLMLDLGAGKEMAILEAAYEVISSIGRGLEERLIELLPDSTIRARTMREVQRFAPQPGDPWAIGLSVFRKSETILDDRVVATIDDWIARSEPTEDIMTVTGELTRAFFDQQKISIRYKPTNKTINCFLRQEVVNEILEDRSTRLRTHGNFQIQVTGKFVLGVNGHPKRLTDVHRVVPVDTSPMIFEKIRRADRAFVFDPPLRLELNMDEESGQLYLAEDDNLGICAFAHTREQLVDEISEQVAFNWREYALCDPKKLAKGARRVREALLARVKDIPNA
jgi:hypothetical protein